MYCLPISPYTYILDRNVQDLCEKGRLPQGLFVPLWGKFDDKIDKIKIMTTDEKIKEAILNYCEGITYCEFNINDLDKMVEEIKEIIKLTK